MLCLHCTNLMSVIFMLTSHIRYGRCLALVSPIPYTNVVDTIAIRPHHCISRELNSCTINPSDTQQALQCQTEISSRSLVVLTITSPDPRARQRTSPFRCEHPRVLAQTRIRLSPPRAPRLVATSESASTRSWSIRILEYVPLLETLESRSAG